MIEVREFDIIITGGGISGAAAAISAARLGKNVLLIEQYGFLGGTLTACGTGPMMTFHAGDTQVVQGICGELISRLAKKGLSAGHILDSTTYTYTVTPFDAEGMKTELESMLLEAGGKLLYHAQVTETERQASRLGAVKASGLGTAERLQAGVYVDATGDANLAAMSGVPFDLGRKEDGACQPVTMNFKMYEVKLEETKAFIRGHMEQFPTIGNTLLEAPRLSIGGFTEIFETAYRRKELTYRRGNILFFETNTPGEVIVNSTRILGIDPTDPWSLTQAEIQGRAQAAQMAAVLKKYVPGFEHAKLAFTGPFIGVRSSRQIRGDYTLTARDVLSCRAFEDSIAHGGYPIDVHPPEGDEASAKVSERSMPRPGWGDCYSIPYRCLTNPAVENLITVGRCISAEFEAQAAIRVSPIAGATGHAGGVAAALTRERAAVVDTVELRRVLREQGAYIRGN